MSVLYLLSSRDPALAGTDAIVQEVSLLCAEFKSETINLHPGQHIPRYPRAMFGFEKLAQLKRAEKRRRITHVYGAYPYYFPVLRWLHNPLVYTIAAGLDASAKPKHLDLLKKHARVVVSNERDAAVLQYWGLAPVIIGPGIDTSRIARLALPLGEGMTLLMASAPWVEGQFDSKGIDAWLDTVVKLPFLKLILLWRGRLHEELIRRVQARGIGDRVEVINRYVDISDYLQRAHAAILVAKRSDLVKAYPNSLIESLTAGKPVIVSTTIPMADFVRDKKCGVAVEKIEVETLVEAVQCLMMRYADFADNISRFPPETFALETMLEKHRQLYERVVPNGLGDCPPRHSEK